MAALKEPVKMFIVQSLACFETPQQVADAVEEIYKIKIDRKQCHSYDPTKYAGRNLSKKLKDLFEQTRKEFRENIDDIAIANKAFRLRELQKMYEDSGKNKRAKQNLLKQAFQETDGRVTKQEITGPDGGPIQQETKNLPQYTPEQLAGMTAQELSRLAINGKL
ncbi:DUF2280 domain-containing protein [Acinetobacter lwoffii]|jgi:hypothetical protein|uniref:DUF2280 domain-containing protein n=2 Tax=Acinetobacter TaxID=469 RepID=N9KQZ9_9GAMM|nr:MULTISPECIES: DUF2280 domain-containing protein [Acinetobacter]ENU16269.1 hypothetical protein F995_01745 [Acinetobacter sp. CIP A162]ENW23349.1 hypothetical protein F925_02307 [Acinetobacter lwoffii NCTC 5866 = CIP 64.10 = NIPH 512]ENW86467.1 hypothetical protein F906_01522 [Acinetobacter pseudolwoffii]ESJ95626.1 hypothetical protein P800_00440 [Acinetobacter lwoffii NCTC 5866 = CIP 64.10 = NIPH 512]MCU4438001.1 DUF2280 domain-containing protein [Acinetobacter lwoffii]